MYLASSVQPAVDVGAAETGLFMGCIVYIIIFAVIIAGGWKMLSKAGLPGIAIIVPIWNSIALAQAARASAVLAGRDHCVPEDIVENVLPVCAHRVVTRNTMHDGDTVTSRRIMQRILETVASPV